MGKRILVIDDDEDILEILSIILQESNYEVVLSNTGDAIDQIEVIHPDLILLDVRIKGSIKDGAQICRELKARYPSSSFPVILVSAESDLYAIAKECKADAFINKPFDIYQLLGQVKEFLS